MGGVFLRGRMMSCHREQDRAAGVIFIHQQQAEKSRTQHKEADNGKPVIQHRLPPFLVLNDLVLTL